MVKHRLNTLYKEAAETAVALEHQGHYGEAASYWTHAIRFAGHYANEDWAQSRLEFCQRMGRRIEAANRESKRAA